MPRWKAIKTATAQDPRIATSCYIVAAGHFAWTRPEGCRPPGKADGRGAAASGFSARREGKGCVCWVLACTSPLKDGMQITTMDTPPNGLATVENDMPDQNDAQTEPQPEASGPGAAAGETPVSAIETNLMKVAEELGTWLGTAERKTADFLAQRNVSEHLVKIRDTAARLLAQIEKARERSR